jgi:diguanylate cyclase (GGDEF)-like protein
MVQSEYADNLSKATNLAYPIGDLLLVALVVGGTAMLSGRSTLPWIVFAGACVLNCVGDTFNLFQSLDGFLRVDAVFHALAWPAAGLVMSVGVWLRPRPVDLLARRRSSRFLLPGLAAFAGLLVLIAGTAYRVDRVALALAIASLVVAGVRLLWSARQLQSLTEYRHLQSMSDELTGLGNRRYLFDICNAFFRDQADAYTDRRKLVFLFVDLNRFKEINDSFGHLAGDELLKQLGPRVTQSLRSSDVLVRIGGDEFGVVLMDADAEYATSVARQLTASLEQPFDLNGVHVSISASIGIAGAPADASDVRELMECADVAMYRSKLGGHAFTFYDQCLDSGNQWRLGDELRIAIEQHQLVLHYQPQLNLNTGTISAVEALVRWEHPKLGMLVPSRFISLAEDAGLMPSLTALLIDDALAQGARWAKAGHHPTISVNISPTNLLDDGFTALVRGLLERHDFPSPSLALEITEGSVIANFERSKSVIEELATLGVVLSIDDFGAGSTSLSYLSSLALGELKLDRTLIADLSSSSRGRDRELVRTTIELGHGLGLRVVAEGVEDEATLDLLRQLRCDLAQGYFISRPMAAEKIDFSLVVKASPHELMAERNVLSGISA